MKESGEIVGRVLGAWVGAVVRRPVLTVAGMLALAGGSLFATIERLGINTDTADMISPELSWRRDFIEFRASFPTRDRTLIAVVEGPTGEASAAFARDLADALEAEPAMFPSVFLAGHGAFFEQNGLLYLPIDDLEDLADRLIGAQPLLGQLADDVSGAGIVAMIREALARRAEGSVPAAQDLDRLLAELAATLEASARGERRPIAWGDLIGAGTAEARRQLVLVQPALDFERVRPAREPIERLRALVARLNAERARSVDVSLTGTLAMEHDELSSITSSAAVAGIAALVMVVAVLWVALRSMRLLAVAIVTLLAGLVLTASFAAVTVGHLNLLSVAFAVLYVGLGVDFILHLCLRHKELRAGGSAPVPALVETAEGVGSSLVICAVTTAAGFLAFLPTDFDGISELGLISGGGMIISLIVSLTLLPALIAAMGSRAPKTTRALSRGTFNPIAPRLTLAIAAAIALGAIVLLPGLRFDSNPIRLRDPDAESIRALEELAADSELPLFNVVALVPDAAAAERLAARLEALDVVLRTQTVGSLVPADQDEKLLLIEDLDLVLGGSLTDLEPGPVAPARLVAEVEALVGESAAAAPAATRAQARAAEAAVDWLASHAALGADEADARARTLDLDLRGNLVAAARRLERALGAHAFGRADLPPELLGRWVNDRGQELVEAVPAENLNDGDAAARFVSAVREVAPNATGLPVVYAEASATVTSAFREALVYALVVVTLLLLIFLKSVRDTLLVLVPIVFAAIVTAALAALFGLPLNFANIIALPLLIGVGVDSGIHMVHRMRTEPPPDGGPLGTSTSKAVLASALTTIASFGNLAFASHVGMASMGRLLTLGMAMSLIAVLVLLPAMMRVFGKPA